MRAPYGTWKSPLTTEKIVQGTIGLSAPRADGPDLYWIEGRPLEGGRCVIVRRREGGIAEDVIPPPFNARTRVHEYGGGDYTVADGTVFFSHFADQRLYRVRPGESPEAWTPEGPYRYADPTWDPSRGRLVCVLEDHSAGPEPKNCLASVPTANPGSPRVLVEGADFYAYPRIDGEGRRLAWVQWSHPDMPWDAAELWVAEILPDGGIARRERVAGGGEESIFQPSWSPDGTLFFVSDRSGWWNLCRWRNGRVETVYEAQAEFGKPLWQLGMTTYAFLSPGRVACAFTERGLWRLGELSVVEKKMRTMEMLPYTDVGDLVAVPGGFAGVVGSPSLPTSLVRFRDGTLHAETIRSSSRLDIDPGYLSQPETIEYPTTDGQTAYAFFYPPKNADFTAPPTELPPLLVKSHGGPTSSASSRLSLDIQFWTSRGFGVLDVNYRGSTGFGREYRKQLNGRWGIADVDDCVAGAQALVKAGRVDGERLAIRGGSAGGYTTLCALTFRRLFKAGASYYGIGDLEALTRDTHKFESRYPERLVGPYPKERHEYRKRSPIHFTDSLSCPIIFFQGLEDKIVPPNQAERMVESLRKKGIPVEYVPFPGEQHGFRKAENIQTTLRRELEFYGKVFGFQGDVR